MSSEQPTPDGDPGVGPSADLDGVGEDVDREAPFALVAQFFIIPLAVVVIAIGLFLAFGVFSGSDGSPAELLGDVNSGSQNRRWQAAYQLATDLAMHPELAGDEELFRKTLAAYGEAREAEVRRYLVLALGRFGRAEATPVLTAALTGDDEETRLYAALALAELGEPSSVGPLLEMLGDESPSLRKAAAYALGYIGHQDAIEPLRVTAEDRHFDVALQGALALSQLGDPGGLAVLHRALDRTVLRALAQTDPERAMTPEQQSEAMIDAMRGLLLLRDATACDDLDELGRSDDDLGVRDAARSANTELCASAG